MSLLHNACALRAPVLRAIWCATLLACAPLDSRVLAQEAPESGAAAADDPLAVDPQLWKFVEHGVPVTPDERAALRSVLQQVAGVAAETIVERAVADQVRLAEEFQARPDNKGLKFEPFLELVYKPQDYVGRLFPITGRLVSVQPFELPGFDAPLFEVQIATHESEGQPYVVLAPEVDLPRDVAAGAAVTTAGVFFKKTRIGGTQREWLVPLIVARRVEPSLTGDGFPPETTIDTGTEIELPPGLLAEVRNQAPLTPAEAPLYYAILAHARKFEPQVLRGVARKNIESHAAGFKAKPENKRRKFQPFVDLFLHPDEYQGQLVEMTGRIRKIDEFHPEDEAEGLGRLYQLAIYTDDSQQNPLYVICSEIPAGIEDELADRRLVNGISFAGYFFKKWVYDAQDTTRVAPLFLARSVEWHKPPPPAKAPPLTFWYVLIAAAALLFFAWQYHNQAAWRRFEAERRAKELEPPPPDLRALPGEPPEPPRA